MAQRLEPSNVPAGLESLLPLVEKWGIPDDYERSAAVSNAPLAELRELVTAVVEFDEEILFGWLSGTAADEPNPSREYVAFTDMTMAADEARYRLQTESERPESI